MYTPLSCPILEDMKKKAEDQVLKDQPAMLIQYMEDEVRSSCAFYNSNNPSRVTSIEFVLISICAYIFL